MKSMFMAHGSLGTKPFCKDAGGKRGEKLQVCYASWKVWGEGRGLVDLFRSGRRGWEVDLYPQDTCVIIAIKTIGFHKTLVAGSSYTVLQQVKKVKLATGCHSDVSYCFAFGLPHHFFKNQHDSEFSSTSLTQKKSYSLGSSWSVKER